MNQYMFLFTISPVQSFISQARKAQDLYAGSRLLSDLIDVTTKALPDKTELIYPDKKLSSKPNRFICVIEENDAIAVKEIGYNLERVLQKELKNTAISIYTSNLKEELPSNFIRQVENYFQINWVSIPCKKDENYKKYYKEIEAMLGAVKNVRIFNQMEGEIGRKCSLC